MKGASHLLLNKMSLNSGSPDKQLGNPNLKLALCGNKLDKSNEPVTPIKTTESLKDFMSFLCDRHLSEMSVVVRSSIDLLDYCIPSRPAVLEFYSQLFTEYSTFFWMNKTKQSHDSNKSKTEYVGDFTRRFYEASKLRQADLREDTQPTNAVAINSSASRPPISSPTKSIISNTGPASPTASSSCSPPHSAPKVIPTGPRVIPTTRRTSSCHSTDIDQTPMSPSGRDDEPDIDMKDETELDDNIYQSDIYIELDKLMSQVKLAIEDLMTRYQMTAHDDDPTDLATSRERLGLKLKNLLANWASDLLLKLSAKQPDPAILDLPAAKSSDQVKSMNSVIDLWLSNPVNKLLVDLVLKCHDDIPSLFRKLVDSNQNRDWLLAYILAELSKRATNDKDFSLCMEYIISYQDAAKSVTHILAHLSDVNPKAMANFPKSNIPFLISLCQTSSSLLNVLAREIPDTINPDFLNRLAKEAFSRVGIKTQPSYIASLCHCIIAAPNSYKLFLLTLQAKVDDRVCQEAKSAAQLIIDSILLKIQEKALESMTNGTAIGLPNSQTAPITNLLNQIDRDLSDLIELSTTSKFIERKTYEILYRMSIIHGHFFASKVIFNYLNLPEKIFWPALKPLLSKFMKHFGDDGTTLVSQTLSLSPSSRKPSFWNNLYKLTAIAPGMKLNLDILSQLLANKLSAARFDILAVAQLLKLCCNSLERVDHARISISTKHKLCKSLATCYFLLLEHESDNFPEILSYLRVSLTCMSLLKQTVIASQILCRALLERSIVYGHLFKENFEPDLAGDTTRNDFWTTDDSIKLSRENMKVTLGHRFRRLPNNIPERTKPTIKRTKITRNDDDQDSPDRQAINCYLLIEAFKSSINNIEAFAILFLDFHCPVMFDKNSWPTDENLRVINEKNLSILRKFEQVPPFWDLYELIGQAGCLKSCLVLIKALLAAHLAMWASATTNSNANKMVSTARLLPPLAKSGLIPKAFSLAVEVFPYLSAVEVYSVLCDVWQYLKDTNSDGSKSPEKAYLNKLRLFMCQKLPGPQYVKIFKEYC